MNDRYWQAAEDWSRAHVTACHCNGTGYVRPDVPPGHPLWGRAVPCACQLEARHVARMARMVKRSGMTEQVRRRWTFETFDPSTCAGGAAAQRAMEAIKAKCETYAQAPEGWLILTGAVGSGKTHLAYAIAGAGLDRGIPVYASTVPDLLARLRASYADDSYTGWVEDLKEVELLVLDDLGAGRETDWSADVLYQIVNARYVERMPMVVTTNLDLSAGCGIEARLLSRLLEGTRAKGGFARVLTLPAADYRPTKGG